MQADVSTNNCRQKTKQAYCWTVICLIHRDHFTLFRITLGHDFPIPPWLDRHNQGLHSTSTSTFAFFFARVSAWCLDIDVLPYVSLLLWANDDCSEFIPYYNPQFLAFSAATFRRSSRRSVKFSFGSGPQISNWRPLDCQFKWRSS